MWALVYIACDSNGVYQRQVLGFFKTWTSAKARMYEVARRDFVGCEIEFAGDYEIDLIGYKGDKFMLFIDDGKS